MELYTKISNYLPIILDDRSEEHLSLFDGGLDLYDFLFKFSFYLLVLNILVLKMYAKNGKNKDYHFGFIAIGSIIFLLCFLLESVKMELGFALGLFAIFGIIRFRTIVIPIKEMTYLFVVIGVSIINALASHEIGLPELVVVNTLILLILWALDHFLLYKNERSMKVVYEKIDHIHADRKEDLVKDLQDRTGLTIFRVEVEDIDFLRDIAHITIFYEGKQEGIMEQHSAKKLAMHS